MPGTSKAKNPKGHSIEFFEETHKYLTVLNGKEVPYTYNYAMVKEDDGWAVSPDGVIECTNVEAPEIVSGKLNIYLSKMIKLVDGYILRADISNNSSKAYSFGKEGNLCKVVVETTEGEDAETDTETTETETTETETAGNLVSSLKG